MSVNLYETKSSKGVVRKYLQFDEHLVPFVVPTGEEGRFYQLVGGAKLGQDFETALEESDNHLFTKGYDTIYVQPCTLANVDFRQTARTGVSLGDYLIVQDLNEDGTPTTKKGSRLPLTPHPLAGKVTRITQVGLEELAASS